MMEDKRTTRLRGLGGLMLLALLAACGYMGSRQQETQTVSVAVTRQSYALESESADAAQDAAARLMAERNSELALLREVIASGETDGQTRKDALAQMNDIAARMEYEAQTVACLEQMGLEDVAAVCGAQMLTILAPYDHITTDAEKTRVIDAVCSLTGFEAGDIKIILTKK